MTIRNQSGFTLLELLIASGLFAMVMLIGFAVISDTATVQARTEADRLVSQSASFSMEAIAREIRLANGLRALDPLSGTIIEKAPPFTIVGTPSADQQMITSSVIEIASTDFLNPSDSIAHIKEIRLSEDTATGHKFVELRNCQDIGCVSIESRVRLTPDSVEVDRLEFQGLTAISDRKPFVQISLTLKTPTDAKQPARQTIRTVVTPRNLLGRAS